MENQGEMIHTNCGCLVQQGLKPEYSHVVPLSFDHKMVATPVSLKSLAAVWLRIGGRQVSLLH